MQLSRVWLAGHRLYPFKLVDRQRNIRRIDRRRKELVLSDEDFRKSKAQRQTVGSSESMNFREVENRGISAAEKRQRRRWRRLLGILNSRSRESSLSWRNATAARSFPLIKYSIEVYKTPSRRMNLIMSSGTNICRREKHSMATRVVGS